MYLPANAFLTGSGRFSVKKVVVYSDSMSQMSIATKIFINYQIKRKYNPFR
jgi:hypothetical protein